MKKSNFVDGGKAIGGDTEEVDNVELPKGLCSGTIPPFCWHWEICVAWMAVLQVLNLPCLVTPQPHLASIPSNLVLAEGFFLVPHGILTSWSVYNLNWPDEQLKGRGRWTKKRLFLDKCFVFMVIIYVLVVFPVIYSWFMVGSNVFPVLSFLPLDFICLAWLLCIVACI